LLLFSSHLISCSPIKESGRAKIRWEEKGNKNKRKNMKSGREEEEYVIE
jgi:hypothetical protein